ncbi:hypothetical protein M2M32_08550 [Weissella cibaria]|uniref:hypothetical protein n=1 Tax=Weissella cibaria TaxID=137591 RepID=UPI0011328BCF|nr:hypothetical protein [Weissella cibaria]MCA1356430.1 hypothetical protein [Weissella cibaria]MDQ2126353.1 hypothetical protein [Weissella cibaria]MDQ2159025.1 hypothetical protein [Weissella cibaria]QDG80410.1 hypothetical protein Wei3612_03055 [Weissella cibaria]
MAIAGVNATKYDTFVVDDMTGALDFDDETGAELVWGWKSKTEAFTPLQVRDILIKFTKVTRGSTVDAELIVDEFMEGGEEE